MPSFISHAIIGYLLFGKKVAPNSDIKLINFFILLLLSEWSPLSLTSISGVEERIQQRVATLPTPSRSGATVVLQ